MTTRAKFKVDNIVTTVHGATVVMNPVISGSDENKEFFKWTPGGLINLNTINEKAAAMFVPGKEYYVDFTIAE